MTETISIANLPPGTPTSDGVTKRANTGDLPSSGGDMLKADNLAGLSNYATARTNLGLNTTANQTDSTDKRFMTDAQEAKLDGITGTNTGDQTSIVGITGTTAQFNTAITDGDMATLAGTETLTNKTLTSPVVNVGSDATGDIYYRNASGILTRLPAGTDGQVLNLASGIPAWTAPSGGGEWTLIETLTPSAVTSFNSSTFTAYDKLRVEISIIPTVTNTVFSMRFNGNTSADYFYRQFATGTTINSANAAFIQITNFAQGLKFTGEVFIAGKGATKGLYGQGGSFHTDQIFNDGTWNNATDITTINFLRSSGTGTFTGTVNIYGKNY